MLRGKEKPTVTKELRKLLYFAEYGNAIFVCEDTRDAFFGRMYVHVMVTSITLLMVKTLQNLSCESSIACYSNPVFFFMQHCIIGNPCAKAYRTGF